MAYEGSRQVALVCETGSQGSVDQWSAANQQLTGQLHAALDDVRVGSYAELSSECSYELVSADTRQGGQLGETGLAGGIIVDSPARLHDWPRAGVSAALRPALGREAPYQVIYDLLDSEPLLVAGEPIEEEIDAVAQPWLAEVGADELDLMGRIGLEMLCQRVGLEVNDPPTSDRAVYGMPVVELARIDSDHIAGE